MTTPPVSMPVLGAPMSSMPYGAGASELPNHWLAITPLKPVRFAWLVRLLMLVYTLSRYRGGAAGPLVD